MVWSCRVIEFLGTCRFIGFIGFRILSYCLIVGFGFVGLEWFGVADAQCKRTVQMHSANVLYKCTVQMHCTNALCKRCVNTVQCPQSTLMLHPAMLTMRVSANPHNKQAGGCSTLLN